MKEEGGEGLQVPVSIYVQIGALGLSLCSLLHLPLPCFAQQPAYTTTPPPPCSRGAVFDSFFIFCHHYDFMALRRVVAVGQRLGMQAMWDEN